MADKSKATPKKDEKQAGKRGRPSSSPPKKNIEELSDKEADEENEDEPAEKRNRDKIYESDASDNSSSESKLTFEIKRKPGRPLQNPDKPRTPKIALEPVKREKGRPVKIKKHLGRPRLPRLEGENDGREDDENKGVPKRGRGRPVKDHENRIIQQKINSGSNAVKRPKGRPVKIKKHLGRPKLPKLEVQDNLQDEENEVGPKRGRGRPVKDPEHHIIRPKITPVKREPGRPKKRRGPKNIH